MATDLHRTPACFLTMAIIISIVQNFMTASSTEQSTADPVVNTKYGQIRGKVLLTTSGDCDAYVGVPFATPPLDTFRWKKPQPPLAWTGIKDTKEFAPACVQMKSNASDANEESEDCLYLNIFAPKSISTTDSLPVMVFIHGGGFAVGSARHFGQDGVCENLVSRRVIVVTTQYRLFMYGFLSTGDEAALGNYGIWDQIQALRWIQENIAAFGGDPNKVTVFGESAGGASVSYLTYTAVAEDLFHQAILQSGSALTYWAALKDLSAPTTKKLAETAKCTGPDSTSFVNCLRQLSTVELRSAYHAMVDISKQDFFDHWAPRVDGEIFKESTFKELPDQKPVIIGVDTMEFPLPGAKDIPKAQLIFNRTLDKYLGGKDQLKNEILKQVARYVYIDSIGDRNNHTFVTQQAAKMAANVMFHSPGALEATAKAAAGRPVWVYDFEYYADYYYPPDFPFQKGAPHAHELCYIFLLVFGDQYMNCPLKYNGNDRTVANHMGEMWTNFAKTGNPSPAGLEWPKFHNVSNANAMQIGVTLKIVPTFYAEISNFWNFLKPNLENSFDSMAVCERGDIL